MLAVRMQPLGAMKCYQFTVDSTGTVLRLPGKAVCVAIYNDTTGTNLFVNLAGNIPATPAAPTAAPVATDKIMRTADTPWIADIATAAIGLKTDNLTPVTVRVEAYFPLDGTV